MTITGDQLSSDSTQRYGRGIDGSSGIIKIAVMAVGGQGGGVLTAWIADLATRAGYAVQMTSVAGVAQRTGATIYYVEMTPASVKKPVFALNPSPGDVDVLIAAELMEAGRAILRGFVTEDKTTLIASNHRVLAVSEKQVPGDGRAEAAAVVDKMKETALKTICFDMQAIADQAGTMISSSLFGALARSGALPFDQQLYVEVIRASHRGVKQSLDAFHAALQFDEDVITQDKNAARQTSTEDPTGPPAKVKRWLELRQRVQSFPLATQDMTLAGLSKTVDYQDLDYGAEYLSLVQGFVKQDNQEREYALSIAAAKSIANAMCYDDLPRVADLKTRSSRDERLRHEQQIDTDDIVQVTEYFHPRAEEFCATLPASLGAWIQNSPTVFSIAQKILNKGRRIRTDSVLGFGTLWVIAGLRLHRRKLLRHRYESAHLKNLLSNTQRALPENYDLAVELLHCQRLIKGYSDTHSRGQSKFKRVTESALKEISHAHAASWLRKLREAALEDEQGVQLDSLLAQRRR
ncbi:MAG: indolepyruvate oxidoreductase subunit beta family protein [Granulosicoccus sp.]